ncbi:hypothetical protein RRG08_063626 [Elysia crispata]|uniref:Uncharacterized protein n=1 Tax=Elysia crispata TaxID=231223 RepID=A0AAE1AIZ9_9GAST|nr:hypothetical protein RRG08_063626 [Elysia crispata]
MTNLVPSHQRPQTDKFPPPTPHLQLHPGHAGVTHSAGFKRIVFNNDFHTFDSTGILSVFRYSAGRVRIGIACENITVFGIVTSFSSMF